jgi:hypothetical protein
LVGRRREAAARCRKPVSTRAQALTFRTSADSAQPLAVDLGFLGMASCCQYASLDVLSPLLPLAQLGTYAMSVPNTPSLAGFAMSAQSIAFVDGVNAAGLVTSNGLQLVVAI